MNGRLTDNFATPASQGQVPSWRIRHNFISLGFFLGSPAQPLGKNDEIRKRAIDKRLSRINTQSLISNLDSNSRDREDHGVSRRRDPGIGPSRRVRLEGARQPGPSLARRGRAPMHTSSFGSWARLVRFWDHMAVKGGRTGSRCPRPAFIRAAGQSFTGPSSHSSLGAPGPRGEGPAGIDIWRAWVIDGGRFGARRSGFGSFNL